MARLGSSDRFCRAKKKTPSSSIGKRLLKYLQGRQTDKGAGQQWVLSFQIRIITHKRPCYLTPTVIAH